MGGKRLDLIPQNYAQDEDSWTTNNNGTTHDESSLAEMLPPPITDGTYLNSALELFEESIDNNVTFNPGTPRPSINANRTFAPGPSSGYEETPKATSGKKRRREETQTEVVDHYGGLKTIVMDPNIPFQAKMGALQTIEGLVNARSGNLHSLVDEAFVVELGRLLWYFIEPIQQAAGTILNVVSQVITNGGQELVKKHLSKNLRILIWNSILTDFIVLAVPLQKLTEKRAIVNKAQELMQLLPNQ